FRLLCQPEPHTHPRPGHTAGACCLPAHLRGCPPAATPLLKEKDLPITQGSDSVSLLHSHTDCLKCLGKKSSWKVRMHEKNAIQDYQILK
uniref:Uncharacterized protein n=1 Tax=Junco hyemalis TaxID=40217 RepID=A0A8C5IAR6_JUNHY